MLTERMIKFLSTIHWCAQKPRILLTNGKNDFAATGGWFNQWQERENIVLKQHTPKKSDDYVGTKDWLKNEWSKILSTYPLSSVQNAKEKWLYCRTILKNDDKSFETSTGRVPVLCCVNMVGQKGIYIVIGKSKSPRCFNVFNKLPVKYHETPMHGWPQKFVTNYLLSDITGCITTSSIPLILHRIWQHNTNTETY